MSNTIPRATIETVAIDPREDGKVEVTFKITADQKRLIECAVYFIKYGMAGVELLEVFNAIAPPGIVD